MKDNDDEKMCMLEECISFLKSIGIQIFFRSIGADSFLPGLLIENGAIVIDRETLQYPGDILHEAGHYAVVPSEERPGLTGSTIIKRRNREAEEMMAIAWSYAACLYLAIDPAFVFHEDGYRGGSSYITDSCSKNDYMGIDMLQSIGMVTSYPNMKRWLRE